MPAALVRRARTLVGWWLSLFLVAECGSLLRPHQQQVSAREEGHLVLQTPLCWILLFLTCFCFSVKVSLLCSMSEDFGRQVKLLCPQGREEEEGTL